MSFNRLLEAAKEYRRRGYELGWSRSWSKQAARIWRYRDRAVPCCPSFNSRTAAHMRTYRHVANVYGVDEGDLRALVKRLEAQE